MGGALATGTPIGWIVINPEAREKVDIPAKR